MRLLTPNLKRRAMRDVMDWHIFYELWACELADLYRSILQYHKQGRENDTLRICLRELANERRRLGYRVLGILPSRGVRNEPQQAVKALPLGRPYYATQKVAQAVFGRAQAILSAGSRQPA